MTRVSDLERRKGCCRVVSSEIGASYRWKIEFERCSSYQLGLFLHNEELCGHVLR